LRKLPFRTSLLPDGRQSHPAPIPKQVRKIAESIRRFGFCQPCAGRGGWRDHRGPRPGRSRKADRIGQVPTVACCSRSALSELTPAELQEIEAHLLAIGCDDDDETYTQH